MNHPTDSLDQHIAELNILITEFILRNHHCCALSQQICKQLTLICQHVEIAFFPQQQIVYLKMLRLWQAIHHSNSNTDKATFTGANTRPKPAPASPKITH